MNSLLGYLFTDESENGSEFEDDNQNEVQIGKFCQKRQYVPVSEEDTTDVETESTSSMKVKKSKRSVKIPSKLKEYQTEDDSSSQSMKKGSVMTFRI